LFNEPQRLLKGYEVVVQKESDLRTADPKYSVNVQVFGNESELLAEKAFRWSGT
jgi:hypothetical protein